MTIKTGLFSLGLLCTTYTFALSADIQTKNQTPALHLDWLNTQVSPSVNFYEYANGSWQKNNPIPPEYASWGSFNVLQEKVQEIIHQMLIKDSQNLKAEPGSITQKVGDFYFSGMDEASIERLGIKPIQPEFERIESLKTSADLQSEIAHLHQIGVDAFFGFGSMQDFKNSSEMIGAAMQGGLGLPDRDYYLKDDPKFKKIREAYLEHVTNMFKLLGDSPVQAGLEAQTVMRIETSLAKASMSQIEQRDPHAIYHMMSIKQLDKMAPYFSWSNYLKALGLPQLTQINLAMPDFFKALDNEFKNLSMADWKSYLRWHVVNSFASFLSNPFVNEKLKLATALTGVESLLPRWKRVVSTENAALGFAIGKLYIEKHFSPQEKREVLDILKNIRAVLHDDISTLTWMTPNTRKEALKKLALIESRVGYPDKWWDYSKLKVDRGPYVLNVIRANEFLVDRDLNKISKPIDRSEWAMTPQTINAYYDASMNNINMPAGILQPPFFDPHAPAAVNYGAIGFIIGHELTHGFDDEGAQFDGKGNLKNWWSAEDLSKFNMATQCIVNQFSQYEVDGGFRVQGKLVSGEATADLGGLTLAYRAFHRSKEYKRAKTIARMTPDQQFFLGAAHVWASNIRPEKLRHQVTTDPHPPAQYRVNGSLANMPQFRAAFQVPDNSPMVNKARCSIW